MTFGKYNPPILDEHIEPVAADDADRVRNQIRAAVVAFNVAPVFRRLRPKELDIAHAILISAAEWLTAKGVRQWTTGYPRELYLASHKRGDNYGLLVGDDLAVVLTLSQQVPPEWRDLFGSEPVWWLSKLATAPRFRGHGLGAAAVAHAIAMLRDQHSERLYLDCVYGQGVLVQLYERLGFRVTQRRKVAYSTGLFDMVLMERQLRSSV